MSVGTANVNVDRCQWGQTQRSIWVDSIMAVAAGPILSGLDGLSIFFRRRCRGVLAGHPVFNLLLLLSMLTQCNGFELD